MARQLKEPHPFSGNAEPPSPPPPPPQREPFRWEWVLVPVCLLVMAYILHHVRPVFSWQQILESLHVHSPERYTRLGLLGLVGIFIVAAVKILGGK